MPSTSTSTSVRIRSDINSPLKPTGSPDVDLDSIINAARQIELPPPPPTMMERAAPYVTKGMKYMEATQRVPVEVAGTVGSRMLGGILGDVAGLYTLAKESMPKPSQESVERDAAMREQYAEAFQKMRPGRRIPATREWDVETLSSTFGAKPGATPAETARNVEQAVAANISTPISKLATLKTRDGKVTTEPLPATTAIMDKLAVVFDKLAIPSQKVEEGVRSVAGEGPGYAAAKVYNLVVEDLLLGLAGYAGLKMARGAGRGLKMAKEVHSAKAEIKANLAKLKEAGGDVPIEITDIDKAEPAALKQLAETALARKRAEPPPLPDETPTRVPVEPPPLPDTPQGKISPEVAVAPAEVPAARTVPETPASIAPAQVPGVDTASILAEIMAGKKPEVPARVETPVRVEPKAAVAETHPVVETPAVVPPREPRRTIVREPATKPVDAPALAEAMKGETAKPAEAPKAVKVTETPTTAEVPAVKVEATPPKVETPKTEKPVEVKPKEDVNAPAKEQIDWEKVDDAIEDYWDEVAKRPRPKDEKKVAEWQRAKDRAERLLTGQATVGDMRIYKTRLAKVSESSRVPEMTTEAKLAAKKRDERLAAAEKMEQDKSIKRKTMAEVEAERKALKAERERKLAEAKAAVKPTDKPREFKEPDAADADILTNDVATKREIEAEAKYGDNPELVGKIVERSRAYKASPSSKSYVDDIEAAERALENEKPLKTERDVEEFLEEAVATGAVKPKEASVLREVHKSLTKLPDFSMIKGHLRSVYNDAYKMMQIKDPEAIFHEYGHWAFDAVLSAKERIAIAKIYHEKFTQGKLPAAFEGDIPPRVNYFTSNVHEYFAEQFNRYINGKVLDAPQFESLFERALKVVKDLYANIRAKGLYDKDMQPFFDSIIKRREEGAPIKTVEDSLSSPAKKMTPERLAQFREAAKRAAEKSAAKKEAQIVKDIMDESLDSADNAYPSLFGKGNEKLDSVDAYDKYFRIKWKRTEADMKVMNDIIDKMPKKYADYTPEATRLMNEMIYEAHMKGIGYDKIAAMKGFDDATVPAIQKSLEQYSAHMRNEVEKVHGKQVNDIWRNEEKGIANTPVFQSQVDTVAKITRGSFKEGALDMFMTPESFFDHFDPAVKELFQGRIRDAQHAFDVEFTKANDRIKALKRAVPRKDRGALDLFTFEQQDLGKKYLEAIGQKAPKYEDLSPAAQYAYQYMRLEYENFYNRLNMMRRMNGLKPFPETKNYFTFMGDLARLEAKGINGLLMPASNFKKIAGLSGSTPFRWDRRRRELRFEDGEIVKLEHDAFKRFEIYQRSAIKHMHFTPALQHFKQLLMTPKEKIVKRRASDVQSKKVREDIAKGKIKPTDMIDTKVRDRLATTNRDAYLYLRDWINDIAFGRERYVGETSGAKTKEISESQRLLTGLMKTASENLTLAYLAGSARLIAIQPTALIGTYTKAGYHTFTAIGKSLSPKARRFALDTSRVLRSRIMDAMYDNLAESVFTAPTLRGKGKAVLHKAGRSAFSLARAVDAETAILSWNAFYDYAKKTGYNDHAAMRYADSQVVKTQSSGLLHERAPVQRSTMGKFFTMFQTYSISLYNMMRYDIGRKMLKGPEVESAKLTAEQLAKEMGFDPRRVTKRQATAMAVRLIAATAVSNALYEELIEIDAPSPAPGKRMYEAWENGDEWSTIFLKGGRETISHFPPLGMLSKGGGISGAGISAIERFLEAESLTKLADAGIAVGVGIPGYGQMKTAASAWEEGETNPVYYLLRRKKE